MWWIPGTVLLVLLLLDIWHDPRKIRIGVLGVVLAWWTSAQLFVLLVSRGSDTTVAWFIVGMIVIGGLAIVLLGLFNIVNGITVLRRESVRVAHMLSLLFGIGLVGSLGYLGAILVMERSAQFIAFEMFRWALVVFFPVSYLAFVFVSFLLLSVVYGLAAPRLVKSADAVIVLGAGLAGDRVTPLLAARLDRGRKVFHRLGTNDPLLVVSGGQGPDEDVPEADAMAQYLIEAGVDPSVIRRETQSRTTEENLEFSAELLREEGLESPRLAVVTNNFHAMRAALLMRSLGLRGHAIGAPTARYYWPSAFLREYVAILRDHLVLNGIVLALLTLPFIAMVIRAIVDLFS